MDRPLSSSQWSCAYCILVASSVPSCCCPVAACSIPFVFCVPLTTSRSHATKSRSKRTSYAYSTGPNLLLHPALKLLGGSWSKGSICSLRSRTTCHGARGLRHAWVYSGDGPGLSGRHGGGRNVRGEGKGCGAAGLACWVSRGGVEGWWGGVCWSEFSCS